MNGLDCLLEGFTRVRQPGIRRYVVVPTLINTIVLIALVSFSVQEFDGWVAGVTAMLPDWLSFLSWLVKLIGFVVVAFALLYLFTIIANFIAAPFNALLAAKVEERLDPNHQLPEISIWRALPNTLTREISKFLYLLPRLVLLLVITIIPGVNALAPFLWILFGGWMMSIQYCDYAADNNDVSFSELHRRLKRRRFQALLFGIPVYFLVAIPIVNLFLIPVAVAGGSAFWVKNCR